MSTDSGRDGVDPSDALMSVTMDVSRAHLLLSGTVDWIPRPVRPHQREALEILDRAITSLRDIAVTISLSPDQSRQSPSQSPHAGDDCSAQKGVDHSG